MRVLRLSAFAARLAQVVVLVLAFTTGLMADTITIGEPADGLNAFPFGGKDTVNPGTRYQQAYASAAFGSASPILITGISFLGGNGGTFAASQYDFFLSTITAGINTLSVLNFDGNRGPNNTLFASQNLAGSSPTTLTITGAPFLYDPSQGNLLMDIVVSPGGVNPAMFPAGYSSRQGTANGIFSRYHNFGFATIGFGLVTRFEFTPVTASVPEPGTLAMLGTGLLGMVCCRLRKG